MAPTAAHATGLTPGIPVVLGAADSVCGALGLGCAAAGDRASLWGTSTVILGVSDGLVFDPEHRFLVTPLAHGERWGLEMDLVSTGSAVSWVSGLLGLAGEEEVFALAERSSPGAAGLTFLPFLGVGEQGALWDPSLRGTVLGLTLQHGREDVARALLEGMAREFRRCVDVLADSGIAHGSVKASGGASESLAFAQMLADASQVPIARPEIGRWASAVGAAKLAASSGGAIDLDSPPAVGGDVVEPDPGTRQAWDSLTARHDAASAAFRGRG
jgi:sugar (pentulose or hexulose) kinase